MSPEISGQRRRHPLQAAQPLCDQLDLTAGAPFGFEEPDAMDRRGEAVCHELEDLGGNGVELPEVATVCMHDTEDAVARHQWGCDERAHADCLERRVGDRDRREVLYDYRLALGEDLAERGPHFEQLAACCFMQDGRAVVGVVPVPVMARFE